MFRGQIGRLNKNHKIMSTFVVFVHSSDLTSKRGLFVKQWSSEAKGNHLERHRVPDTSHRHSPFLMHIKKTESMIEPQYGV